MGFVVDHVSGSHYVVVHPEDSERRSSIPFHGKLKTGTLRGILKEVGVTLQEFLESFMIL